MAHRPAMSDRVARVVVRTLGRLPNRTVAKTFEKLPVERGRDQIAFEAWVFGYELPVESIEDIEIPGSSGVLRARVYRPAGLAAAAPALVYFHGGGGCWVTSARATRCAATSPFGCCRRASPGGQCWTLFGGHGPFGRGAGWMAPNAIVSW